MIYSVLCFFGILIDFFTKKAAVKFLKDGSDIILLEGIFKLSYVENRGAAFGILADKRYVFIVLTVVIVAFLIVWILKQKSSHFLIKLGTAFVISGATGNFIDRVFLGYVVDFLDFYLINFPVFNVADCFVCAGAFLIVIYYLFFEKEKTYE